MTVHVTTRHSEDFDIHTEIVDPAMSPYAQTIRDYVGRINAFYSKLGIRSAMWTIPETERPKHLETLKPVEYLLEIDEDRIAAYVDEISWSNYLNDKRDTFDYSIAKMQYEITSILVPTPITKAEVKKFRRYRRTNGSDKYELVEERTL